MGRVARTDRRNAMTLIVVARVVAVVVIAVLLSLAFGGRADWRQAVGGLLPGWPWW